MKITPITNTDTYKLAEGLLYVYDNGNLTVPIGFVSDGASIPRFLWPLVTSPFNPRVIRAAFVHDYIYGTPELKIKRKVADRIFYEILLEDGTERQVAENMYKSVRDFAGFAWEKRIKQ